MKFRKIEFIDHPILGSVNFDFTDTAGKTVDTIILAGENGSGKSLLLSFLNTYSPNVSAKELGYRLRVEVELADEDVISLMKNKSFENSMGQERYFRRLMVVTMKNMLLFLPMDKIFLRRFFLMWRLISHRMKSDIQHQITLMWLLRVQNAPHITWPQR